jgi:hypothetical protein
LRVSFEVKPLIKENFLNPEQRIKKSLTFEPDFKKRDFVVVRQQPVPGTLHNVLRKKRE